MRMHIYIYIYIYIYIVFVCPPFHTHTHTHTHCWVNINEGNYCYELFHDYAFLRRIFCKLQSHVYVVCLEEYINYKNNVIIFSSHSLRSLSCDWSIASTKVMYPEVLPRASYFKFRYHLLSSKSYCSCLHFVPRLLVSYVLYFIFPTITYFLKQSHARCDQSS